MDDGKRPDWQANGMSPSHAQAKGFRLAALEQLLGQFDDFLLSSRHSVAEIAVLATAFFAAEVISALFHTHHFAVLGQSKALGCAFVGFKLRHNWPPIEFFCVTVWQTHQKSGRLPALAGKRWLGAESVCAEETVLTAQSFGPNTMTMLRPSMEGCDSTTATSDNSSLTRFIKSRATSWW
jgi:hypothetical protein